MKFNKNIIILLVPIFGFIGLKGQPDWSVNAVDYNYSMSFVGVVYLDYEIEADENSKIAAFYDDECRGVASPVYNDQTGNYNFFLPVYSNEDFQTLSFKYFSSKTDDVTVFEQTEIFEADALKGSPFAPYIWATPSLTEAEILSYELEGQVRSEIVAFDINVVLSEDADVTNAAATFEVSGGAIVKIGDDIQISGTTVNDFSNSIEYTVTSADGQTENTYTVNIIVNDLNSVEASSAVTPNGDGVNDVWFVRDVEKFKDSVFYITDSFGHLLFESVGYDNSWDARHNGSPLPVGTYYFVIKKPSGSALSGTISIVY